MKRCLRCDTCFDATSWTCPVCEFEPEIHDGYTVFAPELAQHNDSYPTDFFAHLAELEKGHFWFEARNRILSWAVQQYFPDAKTLFEIGCGTGFVLQRFATDLPDAALYGSDLLVDGLDFAARRVPNATFIQMDARDIPYVEAFDVIGAFDVIEHIEEDERALAQMYTAIKPGGGLIISVPQHQFLWSQVDDLSYHKRRYDRHTLVDRVEAAGFEVITTTSFVSLLLPLMLLNGSRKSSHDAELDIYAEFTLSSALNTALSTVMQVEVALIQMGLRFRWGGSRLLLARRRK